MGPAFSVHFQAVTAITQFRSIQRTNLHEGCVTTTHTSQRPFKLSFSCSVRCRPGGVACDYSPPVRVPRRRMLWEARF